MTDFRKALTELPLCAVRLLVAEHGRMTGAPRYATLPAECYDGSDRWIVMRTETPTKMIRLRHEKNQVPYSDASNSLRKAQSELGHAMEREKNIRKAIRVCQDPNELARHNEYLEAEQEKIVRLKADVERFEQGKLVQAITLYEFPLSEIA